VVETVEMEAEEEGGWEGGSVVSAEELLLPPGTGRGQLRLGAEAFRF
jgi:hypothetical protein